MKLHESPDTYLRAQHSKLIKPIERAITQELEYQPRHPQESRHGRFRRTAHAFPIRTEAAELGQVAATLLIEINSFANPEPWEAIPIATLIHDFLMGAGETDLVRQYELEPFEVLVLADTENLWRGIRSEFHGRFKDMVYGESVPDDDEVLACFNFISASLAQAPGCTIDAESVWR